ncbi:NAD(P)-binding domain-containing protein [Virgibacillus soli]|uniref:NAD(P)-binding domain-containing protein n=1 Tax=Paracerasibacillus soli TaxID=480284 RepID=A0ABU5CU18_9BACI|nr:NAD(P)-binding domain-containing protein [Virgibacillus soli]MDY0409801.1 NAD(P)-binding domain-containing protein [Virgibacillus soli]
MEFNILNQNQTDCCSPETGCCDTTLPVAIIGAGPIGLAAAAHLKQREVPFFILEKGDLAENIRTWEHVRLFSPWKYNIDTAAKSMLEETDWVMPREEEIPTGRELIQEYLEPLAGLFSDKIHANHQVLAITREETDRMKSNKRGDRPFQIYVKTTNGTDTFTASAVIDATGTWGHPNPAASNGLFLPEERQLSDRIDYKIPNVQENIETYANKKIAVIGGGHSAINSLLQLASLKEQYTNTEITWILRKAKVEDAYGGGTNDELAARGELGTRIASLVENGTVKAVTPFRVQYVYKDANGIILKGKSKELGTFDRLIVNTGSRQNFSIHRELRFEADAITEAVPTLAPLIDPNHHSCGSVDAHGEKELLNQTKFLHFRC